MRKAILIMLLAVVSNSAVAEWTKVGEHNGIATYVDMTTIQKKGNIVKMWNMYDYKVLQDKYTGDAFLSIKAQSEYDCEEVLSRSLAGAYFSENMGDGKMNYSFSDPDKWTPVQPSSAGKALWKIACNKE